jgi:hypothetical protein
MSIDFFQPSPLFVGDGEYPDYAHRLDVYTPAEGAIVIVRRRGDDEYVAAGVSQIHTGDTLPSARFTYLPDTGAESLRAAVIYPSRDMPAECRDWLSPYQTTSGQFEVSGVAYSEEPLPADFVRLLGADFETIASAIPDGTGAWSAMIEEGTVYVVAFHDGCNPKGAGSYYKEHE